MPNKSTGKSDTTSKNFKKHDQKSKIEKNDYLFAMGSAPTLNVDTHWFQIIPATFFTALVVIITRMYSYEMPLSQFFWFSGENQQIDFFSYYKMVAILICACLALIIMLYRIFTQSLFIKRSAVYLPMIVYSIFVLLSYFFSDYKEFALWGWKDRFEGTLTLLAYMVMLFFIINSVNTEKNVKWIIYPLAASSSILGILGLSQAFDHDFFRTTIGKKLITPSWFWDQIDSLKFTFQNKEIYQTVYNINYVSFYLTLLIPLFGMLFIRSFIKGNKEVVWKKFAWGTLFTLLIFNLIGSASSGGLMGVAVVVFIAVIILNKRIIEWWKPVIALLTLTIIIAGVTSDRWVPELTRAFNSVFTVQTTQTANITTAGEIKHKLDFIETTGQAIVLGSEGDTITFETIPDDPQAIKVIDSDGKYLKLVPTDISPIFMVNDARFSSITVQAAQDESNNAFIVIGTDGNEWPFMLTDEGPKYYTGYGKIIDLRKIPAVGFENNQGFGSGRGYIWSRTIPLMKDTIILGHGADTYCAYYPQDDYVGKYNSPNYYNNINIIIDKPHNMYMGMIIGTGGISLLALLVLYGLYIIQSFGIYRKEQYKSFISFAGAGIFFGICGFLASAMVNDSTVSVMPMFYGLLGVGIAINLTLKEKVNSGHNE